MWWTRKTSELISKILGQQCPGPTGERQEHLDAIASSAGDGQKRRLFRGLGVLTIKCVGRETCRKSAASSSTRSSCSCRRKKTSKQFDDDEWIRSLTEAHEITTDVPEDSVMYDQYEVDSQKVRVVSDG